MISLLGFNAYTSSSFRYVFEPESGVGCKVVFPNFAVLYPGCLVIC